MGGTPHVVPYNEGRRFFRARRFLANLPCRSAGCGSRRLLQWEKVLALELGREGEIEEGLVGFDSASGEQWPGGKETCFPVWANGDDGSNTRSPQEDMRGGAIGVQQVSLGIIHVDCATDSQGRTFISEADDVRGSALFSAYAPTVVAKNLAFVVAADAIDASGAELLGANERFASELAIGAQRQNPVGMDIEVA